MINGFQLSPQQKRLWSLGTQAPAAPFRAQCAVSIAGRLDPERLQRALREVVARHEILRTRFHCLPGMTLPLQVIEPQAAAATSHLDLRDLDVEQRRERVSALVRAGGNGREELAAADVPASPLEVAVVAVGAEEHLLLLRLPALCADGPGLRNLVQEIGRAYAAAEGELPEVVQYADLAAWQNELLEAEERAAGREYWREQGISLPQLPAAAPAAAGPGFHPDRLGAELPPSLVQACARVAGELETPPWVVLLACWQILVWRLTGEREVVVGTIYDGRRYAELRDVVGLLARTLPLRARVEEDAPFAAVVREAGRVAREQAAWQEYFTWEGTVRGEGGAEPFAPYAFESDELPPPFEADSLVFSIVERYACTERFDLKLVCRRRAGEAAPGNLELHFDPRRYGADEARRMLERLLAVVDSALEAPGAAAGDLRLVGAEEARWLRSAASGPQIDLPRDRRLHEPIEQQARRRPEALALIYEDQRLSYAELDRRANRLAHRLLALGAGTGSRVAVAAERSVQMIVGVLAVLKTGAAYVSLDPAYPKERLTFLIADSQAEVLLAQEHLVERLPEVAAPMVLLDRGLAAPPSGAADERPPAVPGGADDLAYVIYTSGSSGRPKGVEVSHRNAVHSTWARISRYDEPCERQMLLASFAFDSSVAGIFWTLCQGGTLVLTPEGAQREPRALLRLMAEHRVSVFTSLPSFYALLLAEAEPGQLAALRTVVVAGEACTREVVARHHATVPGARLFNEYGPTEGTVWATTYECRPEDGATAVAIGAPIPNCEVHVLHARLGAVPAGVPGEVFLSGGGLARGYHDRPDLTAERFLPHPCGEPGARIYRTGDLARWRADGQLEFLGRADEQVKVRGYRVELGEIEALLEAHPGVRQAAVVTRGDDPGDQRLAAFVTPDEESAGTVGRLLRLEAAGLLPRHRRAELPNGLVVAQYSRNETDFLYREIFEERGYAGGGIALPDGACVFDVGANVGLFSLFVTQECRRPALFCFEPIPQVCEIARLNAELHGLDAKVFDCGLAAEARRETFTFYPHLSLMSGRHVDAAADREAVRSFELGRQVAGVAAELIEEVLEERLRTERVDCELTTLSRVIREHAVERIDLLKIDAERSELEILAGLDAADWPKVRQVVLETQEDDGALGRVTALLEARGFRVAVSRDTGMQAGSLCKVFAVRPDAPVAAGSPRRGGWSSPGALAADLRAALAEQLPEHLVPSALRLLEVLPLTPNGKVDRRALANMELADDAEAEYVAPASAVEEVLAGIWGEVLDIERVSADADFFALGGHSLVATQVMSRVREGFGVDLPVRTLFRHPTVQQLAAAVAQAAQAQRGDEPPPIATAPRQGPLPLSFAQQRLWFVEQVQPGSPDYNIASAVRLSGALDVHLLERGLQQVVDRHEVLRSAFPMADGEPVLVVLPLQVKLPLTDLSLVPEEDRERDVLRQAREEAHTPFDLARGPLLRLRLLRLAANEHVILLTMHHIVSDAWSTGVLLRELAESYRALAAGRPPALPALPIQYVDFAHWQRQWLRGEPLERQLAYWRGQLGGGLPTLDLPADRPRPPVRSSAGGKLRFTVAPAVAERLRELARGEGATLFMTLLAAFEVLLRQASGQNDIVVGTNVAGRNRLETEGLIGLFINQLVLRTDLSGDPPFRELLGRVREVALGAYAHQDLPFERLVEELRPERDLSRSLLYQVKFELHNVPPASFELPGLTLIPLDLDRRVVRYDVHLAMWDREQGLSGILQYSTELFDEATMASLVERFAQVLARVAEAPDSRLSELDEALAEGERRQRSGRQEERRQKNLQQLRRAARKTGHS